KHYDVYALLGGFPGVLAAYLKNNDVKEALDASNLLLESLVDEIREKTGGGSDLEKWESTLGIVVNGIVSGLHSFALDDEIRKRVGGTYDNPCEDKFDLKDIVEWLSLSNVIVPYPAVLDLNCPIYLRKHMFSDLGLLRYFCEVFKISDSIYKGFAAENFVALTVMAMLDALEYPRLECFDSSVLESPEEAIFIIRTPREKTILLQVRSSSSGMSSSEKILARGEADYVIRLTDQLGSWNPGERIVTMPIYALDKLPIVLSRMDTGELEEKGPNAKA
ncbi:MAG: hypothetical protein LBT59_01945, partial [Clostridiales bacterium]|nr:hypothetical protein [Clostridiales bacterium]